MPNCFSLTRKGEKDCSTMQAIDAKMCIHFGAPCDEKRYHAEWYNIIGFSLACGKSFESQREEFRKQVASLSEAGQYDQAHREMHYIAICDWLEANYTSDAWCERR